MTMLRRTIFLVIIAVCCTNLLVAAGTYDFLRSDVSARAAALGGNFLTIQDDPNSIFYNPAGLATIKSQRVSFGFFKHLLDINAGHASYATTIPSFGNVGAGLVYFNYGDFDRTDENGTVTGTFNAEDFALTLGYGNTLENGIEYGVNAKMIYSAIAGYHSAGVALDFGTRYALAPDRFIVGASILNLGTQFDSYISENESLPLDVRVGAVVYPEHLPAGIMLSFIKLNEKQDNIFKHFSSFLIGVEFTASEYVTLRAGYNNEQRRDLKLGAKSGIVGFSLGAGFHTDLYSVDYAFSSLGNIGALHRISVGLAF